MAVKTVPKSSHAMSLRREAGTSGEASLPLPAWSGDELIFQSLETSARQVPPRRGEHAGACMPQACDICQSKHQEEAACKSQNSYYTIP